MPRGFWFPDPSVRIWTPESLSPETRNWNSTLIGRVAPGQDVRAMEAPVAAVVAMLDERFDYPAQWDKTKGAHIMPIRDDIVGGMSTALYATLGAMALILLIACANVAALMLGQIDARSTELAVPLALGAHRMRLVQQMIVEAVLIGCAAGALGAAIAWGGFRGLSHALPLGAWTESTAPDWTVFASAMAIALVAALIVVLVPTVSLWRGDLRPALRSVRSGKFDARGGRLECGLVVAEVALAMLIASGAALLARSVANLYALDPGLRAETVGVIDVMLGGGQRASIDALTSSLGTLPGVRAAAMAQKLPLTGGGYNAPLRIAGHPDTEGMSTEYRIVTPGYFEIMGIALRVGSERRSVEAHVLARALRPAGIGVAVGGAGTWIVGRLFENRLFGVDPGDPATLAAAAGKLVLTALAASWIPARPAGAIDPVETLRQE